MLEAPVLGMAVGCQAISWTNAHLFLIGAKNQKSVKIEQK